MLGGAASLASGVLPTPFFAASTARLGNVTVAPDRLFIGASEQPAGTIVHLAEAGREGLFRCVDGAPPTADPLQGLYVPVNSGRRYFARLWDGTNGRPEWFGARTNDWRFDCADAIEACFSLCPFSHLGQADYFVRRTIVLNHGWRTLAGVGGYATDQGQGTRIVLQGQSPGIHDADIILVGSLRQPAKSNEGFPFEIHLTSFTLIRDGPSAPHPSGDLRRYPVGLRASFLTRCSFSDIASLESSVGFYFGGTVYTKVDDCLAQRLQAGAGGGTDLAAGFYFDGSPDVGLAGGNASLYLNRCLAVGQHPSHVQPTGLIVEGAFVDSFIDHFESARIDNGIAVSAKGAPRPTQTIDLHIRNAVLDGCGGTGLDLDLPGAQSCSVEIADPYVYAAGPGGKRGIAIRGGGGLVTLTGGQVHGDFTDASLLLDRTAGVRIQGLKLHEGSRPVVVRDGKAMQIEPQISNRMRRTANFAVTATDVSRTSFRPIVLGAPGMLGGGVSLDALSDHCFIEMTAIDPACFDQAGDVHALWFGGADASRGDGAAAFAKAGNRAI